VNRGTTLAILLAGAGLGFVASAQPWWRASGDGAAVSFSGSDVTGGLCQALAAVALAGVLLVLVLRARGRRILAVALALTGLGMVISGALQSAPDADTVRSRVRQVSLTDQFALTTTAWPWVYVVAGLLVLAGAVLLWIGAPRWTARVSRFERATAGNAADATTGNATTGATTVDLADDPARAWKDLDAGLDPTTDAETRLNDPDVRTGGEGATMEPIQDHRRE